MAIEKIDPKEYLTKELKIDYFTEEEINQVFEQIAENRKEEIKTFIEAILNKEPLLSKKALSSKLKDIYALKEIEVGLESVDIDWKEQVVKASEKYINTEVEIHDESYSIISRESLHQFLVKEKDYTLEEAVYGIEESDIDLGEQGVKQVEYYLIEDSYSKKSLMEMLTSEDFSF